MKNEIKLLTIDEEPSFRYDRCIVCKNHNAKIVIEMGSHQTQLCMNCLQTLKQKIIEKENKE